MNWTRSLPTGHILTLHGVGRECLRTRERTQLLLGFRGPPQLHAEKERAALCSFQRPGLPVASVGALQEARQDLSILPAQSFLV